MNLVFKLLQALGRRLQRLVLDEHRLGEIIGGIGLFAKFLGDQIVGLAVARRRGYVAHAIEEIGQQTAFFRGHRGSPFRSLSCPSNYLGTEKWQFEAVRH